MYFASIITDNFFHSLPFHFKRFILRSNIFAENIEINNMCVLLLQLKLKPLNRMEMKKAKNNTVLVSMRKENDCVVNKMCIVIVIGWLVDLSFLACITMIKKKQSYLYECNSSFGRICQNEKEAFFCKRKTQAST